MPRTTRTQALLTPQRSVITLDPSRWARSYQKPTLLALLGGRRRDGTVVPPRDRMIDVWHRGGGKDYTWLKGTSLKMLERPGSYYHGFPTMVQGRSILWDGITEQGTSYLDVFAPELIAERNETVLMIRLKPANGFKIGSTWQILGMDNLQKRRGYNPAGIVLSEYQDMPPSTFEEIFEPRLLTNRGWAGFCFTPRGENHAFKLWESARIDPEWFTDFRTIDDTKKDGPGETGEPVITEAHIERLRRRGVPEELIQQEYYCSFKGSLIGAILAGVLAQARRDGRITAVPWEVNLPVKTAWDLGKGDGTAIWFYQVQSGQGGRMYRFIDYWFGRGMDMADCCRVVRQEKAYLYNDHVGPWDLDHDFGMGQTRKDIAADLGVPFRVAPRMLLEDAIDATRTIFSRCVFDERKCSAPQKGGPSGLAALGGWRFEWDRIKEEFSTKPVHDANSHAGDAFRTFAVAPCDHNDDEKRRTQQTHAAMNWNPHTWATGEQPGRYALGAT